MARIILTRPAVEAGERLGFLPGDMLAKVDPYLRPLFDALYDMLDPERANAYMERGTIEVAPLAFMRGRAQPCWSQVLTPEGFWPIGKLRVGDLVTGSNGQPTRFSACIRGAEKRCFAYGHRTARRPCAVVSISGTSSLPRIGDGGSRTRSSRPGR